VTLCASDYVFNVALLISLARVLKSLSLDDHYSPIITLECKLPHMVRMLICLIRWHRLTPRTPNPDFFYPHMMTAFALAKWCVLSTTSYTWGGKTNHGLRYYWDMDKSGPYMYSSFQRPVAIFLQSSNLQSKQVKNILKFTAGQPCVIQDQTNPCGWLWFCRWRPLVDLVWGHFWQVTFTQSHPGWHAVMVAWIYRCHKKEDIWRKE
jgi:hypothetical protein